MAAEIDPQRRAAVRRAYERTDLTVREIAELAGISVTSLHKHKRQEGWASRRRGGASGHRAVPPAQPPTALPDEAAEVGPADRADIARRLWAALDRHIRRFEEWAPEPGEARAAERLATLTRTLEKLIEVERDMPTGGKGATLPDDEGPQDIDQFRDEIARRLEGLLGSGPAR